ANSGRSFSALTNNVPPTTNSAFISYSYLGFWVEWYIIIYRYQLVQQLKGNGYSVSSLVAKTVISFHSYLFVHTNKEGKLWYIYQKNLETKGAKYLE
ncbi:MAG: hypothetical protein QM447_06385, partial [Thermotogota bacterium]|nr:hypothetical protein [Thermotogota bacterium]